METKGQSEVTWYLAWSLLNQVLITRRMQPGRILSVSSTEICFSQLELCLVFPSDLWMELQNSPSFQIWQEPKVWRACKTHTHTHTHTQRNASYLSMFAVVANISVCFESWTSNQAAVINTLQLLFYLTGCNFVFLQLSLKLKPFFLLVVTQISMS